MGNYMILYSTASRAVAVAEEEEGAAVVADRCRSCCRRRIHLSPTWKALSVGGGADQPGAAEEEEPPLSVATLAGGDGDRIDADDPDDELGGPSGAKRDRW